MKHFLITIITIIALVGCGGAEERKAAYLEKAKLSLETGDLDKARIELKNVLQIDPKDARASFQLGNVFEQKKEYSKAFRYFSIAAEHDPDNLEYHAKIGRYHLVLAGDIDKATEIRDLILGKDKNNVDGMLLKAGILLQQNDMVSAKKISQDIFSKQPGHVENTMFLSTLYLREKEYEDSISVLNTSIKQNPNNTVLKKMLANSYFTAGRLDQAENKYKEILEQDPEVFSNYIKLATFYREIGKIDKAEEVLRNAIEVDEEDSKRKLVLVDFIQKNSGYKNAIEELKALIAKNPEVGDLRLSLARFYVAEGKLDDAEKIFKSAILDFSDASVGIKSRVDLANLYMQKRNIDAAVSVIDDALDISPNDSEVNFVKAKLQVVNRKYEGAIISLRTVIKDDPENIEAYILLSRAHRANAEEEQADEIINRAYENNRINAKGLMALARYHAKNKNNAKLEKVIDNYLSIDANNYEALSFKSTLLNERKMFSEAKPYVSRMVQLHPNMPNGYIQSVPLMLAENRKNEAVNLLEEGYKKVNEKTDILEALVSLYVSMKDFDAAISKVQSVIDENGATAELYIFLARIQVTSGKLENAITSLNKARNIRPDWNEPYLYLANIYEADKQNQKAIEALQHGLKELKGDLKLSLSLAKIYESLSDFNSAINVYEKLYEKYTDNVILVNNLASLLSEHRNDENSLKRAKELADRLKNINQPVILDTVGWIYYKVGNYAEAVTILKTVVEKSPEVALFNYHLGMALYKTGDEVAAKTYLTNSLANNSRFPGKDDAEFYLQKLQ